MMLYRGIKNWIVDPLFGSVYGTQINFCNRGLELIIDTVQLAAG